ncbi:acyl-CoA synthetase [Sphaerisporangium rufum]|uniref:Acyl-CoA synthetase n=1 Tax=Sphaerisporangium rufum TaxID=1381558 RepID=A0A919UYX8_9ACTN|nr:class I adenylate-forming enzyme family protein [Sphaerisporangium rufum]GII78506.1 acyl-CoA synthetase [Sphaerisporangium rufum]
MSPAVLAAAPTIPGLLAARARAEPDGVALTVHGAGSLTFAGWDERASAAAAGLAARGVRPGDRVGLVFGEREWDGYAVAYCAVQRAGAVAVPLPAGLPPARLDRLLAHASAARAVHGTDRVPEITTAAPIALPDLESGGGPDPGVPVRPQDPAQILYTSGTTGEPKGVVACHANLTHGTRGQVTDPRRRPLAHSRHFLHAFPIGTNAAQTMLVNMLDARPGALTLPRFTAARFARLIESYRAGTVFLVPSMAIELLNAGVAGRYDLSSVLLLGSTAAALAPPVALGLAAAFPRATIVNYYTSTEAAPAQTTMVFDPERPDSVGRPAAGGTLRILNDGRPVPPGTAGEVWMRSPAAPRGYLGDPDTRGEVFRDGWVRMGDLGRLDEDGYLYLLDRESDIIKSGAFKVSTLRIEAALLDHPAVAEVAVVGVPHPVMGAVPAAAAVARAPVTPAELRTFLAGRLAGHEVPARWTFLPSLPKNPAGKVLKRDLRALLHAQEGDDAADHP